MDEALAVQGRNSTELNKQCQNMSMLDPHIVL